MQRALLISKKWFLADSWYSFLVKTFLGANIIALCAQISIPLQPVPITGQTLGVTLIGFALGARGATAAVLGYLLEGALGLPVFAGGSGGVQAFFGASGGYLWGFIPAAWILGYASDKKCLDSFWLSFAAAILSAIATFACGLAQLSFFVPVDKVLAYGFYPFIIGGMIKALVASISVVPTYKFFQKL